MSRALESRAFAAKAKMFQALESSSSLRGFEKAKAIHNTESTQIDCHALQGKARNDGLKADSMDCHSPKGLFKDKGANDFVGDFMDCHAFANAKSRNDNGTESSKQGHSNIVNGSVDTETQDSRRQDFLKKLRFSDKNGALRVLRMRHIEIYAAVRKTKQSPFLA